MGVRSSEELPKLPLDLPTWPDRVPVIVLIAAPSQVALFLVPPKVDQAAALERVFNSVTN